MRFIAVIVFFFMSCSGKTDKQKTTGILKDSSIIPANKPDTIVQHVQLFDTVTQEEVFVNATLQEKNMAEWTVLNDKIAHWMKDAFDYFILPKRKEYPNYPYIALGDYNADGKTDTAAVVTDSARKNYRIAILLGNEIKFWDEDIGEDAAINTLPKPGEIKGMADGDIEKTKIVRMKGDGIEVNYFEQSSFVLYWNGKAFKRIQTSD